MGIKREVIERRSAPKKEKKNIHPKPEGKGWQVVKVTIGLLMDEKTGAVIKTDETCSVVPNWGDRTEREARTEAVRLGLKARSTATMITSYGARPKPIA